MAEQQEQIIIGVEIDVPDVADKLSAVSAEVQKLKDRRDELNRIVKEGGELTRKEAQELASVEKELKAQIATQKSLTGQLQASQASTIKLNGSFREMDAQLRQLENQYKALNKADRNTAEGLALKEAIIQQKQALKEFDAELGNHQRNVGNYPSALKGVFPVFDQLNGTLGKLGVSLDDLQANGLQAFTGLGKSVKAFGKMFITPPIIIVAATLGAILLVAEKLKEAFARNDEASTKLQAAFAKLQPIGDLIGKLFLKLADLVADLVDKMMSAYEWIIKLANKLGIVSDEFIQATEASANLVRSIDDLQEAERNYAVNSARRNRDIAKYRILAQEADNPEKRMEYLKRAIELEKQNLEERKKIAQQALNNLIAQQEKSGDTDDKLKGQIADAKAALFDAETAFFEGTRRLIKQFNAAEEEYNKTLAQMEEDAAKCIEILNTTLAPIREDLPKLTEAQLQAMRDNLPQIAEEIEEEVVPALNDWQKAVADLMKQGYTFSEAQKIVTDQMRDDYVHLASTILFSLGEVFQSLSDLLDEFADKSKGAAGAAKAFSLIAIIANHAAAISEGVLAAAKAVEAASSVPWPFNLAAIATSVAEITGIITSVISGITQAKQVLSDAKGFATGGIVGGTSYEGDRLTARVNSGEMILTKEQQAQLFDIANGQNAGQFDMVTAAMTTALRNMPAPTMVYKEFEQFQKNVATYKEITAL